MIERCHRKSKRQIAQFLIETGIDERLKGLARQVECNVPARRDPDRFHEEKSEIANDLVRLSRGEM